MNRSLRNLREMIKLGGDLLTGQYYSFVYGGEVRPEEIPSFCFHGVKARYFERVLAYMKDNNYVNLTAEDFLAIRQGKRGIPANAIMLSFDDGTGSMWSVAYPLLEKYGFRATVFLIPGRISTSVERYPCLKDVWGGRAKLEEVDTRDKGPEPFLTWAEVREMHGAGVVDFQSHGLEHRQVFISPVIVDYVRPENIGKHSFFQFSMFDELDLKKPKKELLRLGAPIYQSAPRLSDAPRYFEDPALREACINFVKKSGGAAFFESKDWRRRLDEMVRLFRSSQPVNDGYESRSEQRHAILRELSESRLLIETHLPGKQVRHFCYPWGVSGDLSQQLIDEAGYETAYTGRIGRNIRVTLDRDSKELYRVGPDFFFLLPGKGRDSLLDVLKRKVSKRARRGTHHLSY